MPKHSWVLKWATHNNIRPFSGYGLLSFQAKKEETSSPWPSLKSFSLSQRLGFPNFMNSVLFPVAKIDYPRCTPLLCDAPSERRLLTARNRTRARMYTVSSNTTQRETPLLRRSENLQKCKTLSKAAPWALICGANWTRLCLWYVGSNQKHCYCNVCKADSPPHHHFLSNWMIMEYSTSADFTGIHKVKLQGELKCDAKIFIC